MTHGPGIGNAPRPTNLGGRFSLNAFPPSRASSEGVAGIESPPEAP